MLILILLIVLIILVIFALCMQGDDGYYIINDFEEHQPRSLNELDNPCISREYIPEDPRDHVETCWKSDYSHPYTDDIGRTHTRFSSDLETPLRSNIELLAIKHKGKLQLPKFWMQARSDR